jgi:hypothetical protein
MFSLSGFGGGMGCEDNTCGTGGWSGPLPGDPDNNSVLSATPAFGGIDVSWTFPAINPFALAYTTVYRGLLPEFDSAITLVQVGGNTYYDKQDNSNRYYYWIRFVSVNGTEGTLIGPASATARPTIEHTIEQLTGRIDAGVLAQSLKQDIDKIALNYGELTNEIANRISSNAVLSAALRDVQNGVEQSLAFVEQEITTRQTNDSALASQLTVVAALTNTNAAAIIEEKTARVTATDSLAQQITTTNAATAANAAALIKAEETARTTADSALATSLTTAQTTLNGNIASVQSSLQSSINTTNGKVTAIGALYTAKVTVNGLVGGFGIYNNGVAIDAGFDVDTFWIGRTSANKRKPFIVQGNETFIDEAVINKLTFTKLRAEDGSVVIENGKLKASYIDTKGLIIRDASGNAIFGAGVNIPMSMVAGLGAFAGISQITAGNASTFITNGAIGTAQIGNAVIGSAQIAYEISSSNFASSASGWAIRKDGYAEFNDVVIRRNTMCASGILGRTDTVYGNYVVAGEKGSTSTIYYQPGEFLRGKTFYIETGFTDFDAVTNPYSPGFYGRIDSPNNGTVYPAMSGNIYDLAFEVIAAPARTWGAVGSGTAGQRVVLVVTPIIKVLQSFDRIDINNYRWALFRQR